MPAIEVPFEIVFPGLRLANGLEVSYIGYIDMIMYSAFLDQYTTVDLKTNRSTRSDKTADFLWHGQMIPYGLVLEHILGKDVSKFSVMYASAFVDVLEPRVDTYVFNKTQADIEDWVMNLVLSLKNLNEMVKVNHFPRTEHGCLSWNRPCHFLDVCGERDSARLQSIFLYGEDPEQVAKKQASEFLPWITIELELPIELGN
jgi:hypothetical protein